MTDIGYIIGTIIACLLVLLGLAAIGVGLFIWRADDEPQALLIFGGGGLAWVLVVFGLWVWATFPPFDMEYHQWRPVAGQVQSIDARLIASGANGGSTQNFVVVIDNQEYRCDDSRCATVHAGDHLSLRCQRVWQYASVSGYECRFVDVERAKS